LRENAQSHSFTALASLGLLFGWWGVIGDDC